MSKNSAATWTDRSGVQELTVPGYVPLSVISAPLGRSSTWVICKAALPAYRGAQACRFERIRSVRTKFTLVGSNIILVLSSEHNVLQSASMYKSSTPSILFYMTPLIFFFNFDQHYLINQLVKWSEISTFTSIIKNRLLSRISWI